MRELAMASRPRGGERKASSPGREVSEIDIRRPRRKEPVAITDALNAFLRASGISGHVRHLAVFQAWDA
jgi:hypothetical protein